MKDFKAKLMNSWKSWTNWFNTTGVIILQVLVSEPSFQEYLSMHDLMLAIVIGNIILRFKTTSSLADK